MRSFSVLGLLCSIAFAGCATKSDVQRVDRKVDDLAIREDGRWDEQVRRNNAEPDRILQALRANPGSSGAGSQLGGGPTRHVPTPVSNVRGSNPNDPRFQWTQVWDQATNQWIVEELPLQARGPMGGYSGATPPSGGYAPPGMAPPQPSPPPQPAPSVSPPSHPHHAGLTRDDIKKLVRKEMNRGKKSGTEVEDAAARGAERGLSKAIADVTPHLEQLLLKGKDQTKADMASLKEEMKREFEAALKLEAAEKGYVPKPLDNPNVVIVNNYRQDPPRYVPGGYYYYRTWWGPAPSRIMYYRCYPHRW